MNHKTFIIAEAGVNHNGDIESAKMLIDAVALSGADGIKFQTFKATRLVCKGADKADYQKKWGPMGESQLEMLRRLELDGEAHKILIEHSKKRGVTFLSSAFDLESLEMLSGLGVDTFKVPSGEITNLPYLRRVGGYKKKVILSTGMADIGEIEEALKVIVDKGTPKEDVTVLHCSTEYPTSIENVNLLAMLTIQKQLEVNVGYSDHTEGIEVALAAVVLGARIVEKHVTLDKNMEGPDHKASLEPDEMKSMVEAIRKIEKALGTGKKEPSPSERKNMVAVRKSIVAARDIEKGETFTERNLTTKRPGKGICPMRWDEMMGQIASRAYREDELI